MHTMVPIDKALYIFGGFDGVNRYNDCYSYNTETKVWNQVITNDMPPSPRDRHSAVVHKRSMFIFGGFDGINKTNDFYEYNVDSNTWQEVLFSGFYN